MSLPASPLVDCLSPPTYTAAMLTYTTVIAIALDSAPDKRLPLKEIYRFFLAHSDSISLVQRPNWKNSVRHTLSGHPCFEKVPPPPNAKASRTWLLVESRLPRCSIQPLHAYREVMGRASANGGDRFDQAMTEVSRLERPGTASTSAAGRASAITASPAEPARSAAALPQQQQQQQQPSYDMDEGSAMANILLAQAMQEEQHRLLARDVDVNFADMDAHAGFQQQPMQMHYAQQQQQPDMYYQNDPHAQVVTQLMRTLEPNALNRLLGDIAGLMQQPQQQAREQQPFFSKPWAVNSSSPSIDAEHSFSGASSGSPATLSVSGASPAAMVSSVSAPGANDAYDLASHNLALCHAPGDAPADQLLSFSDEELALLSDNMGTAPLAAAAEDLYDFHDMVMDGTRGGGGF